MKVKHSNTILTAEFLQQKRLLEKYNRGEENICAFKKKAVLVLMIVWKDANPLKYKANNVYGSFLFSITSAIIGQCYFIHVFLEL